MREQPSPQWRVVMVMRTTVSAISAGILASLALCASASADRAGVGQVDAPLVIDTYHVTFTLAGDSWAQVADVLSGDPIRGVYAFQDGPVGPDTSEDHLVVFANAMVQHSHPVVRNGVLVVNPASRTPRRAGIRQHGTDGPVRWWTWSAGGFAEATGYQAAPPGLRDHGRWLVYRVGSDIGQRVPDKGAAKRTAVPKVLAVARTMRLAHGPIVTGPPFAGS
jgi:hypothetical protein